MNMANSNNQNKIELPAYLRLSKILVWVMYFWVMLGIISLILRVLLLAFSANPTAGFSQFIAKVSSDYMDPFRGIFPPHAIGETGYLDVSAIFAIVVYIFLAWGISALISYVQNKIDITTAEQEKKLASLSVNK